MTTTPRQYSYGPVARNAIRSRSVEMKWKPNCTANVGQWRQDQDHRRYHRHPIRRNRGRPSAAPAVTPV
jgi:hypothetical protein